MNINKILVPVDFSESAVNAMHWACSLAEKLKAEIILFNAFEIKKSFYENESFSDIMVLTKDIRDEKKEKLKELALHTGYKKKIVFDYLAESGSLQNTLKDAVKKTNSDLIIMGSAGAEDQRNYLFGSNATDVIRNLDLPLLIVPVKSTFSELKSIVFASTFSIEDLEPILFLSALSNQLDAKLTLLHIGSDDIDIEESRMEDYRKLIDRNNPGKTIYYELLYHETILDGINEYIKTNNVDLLGINHRVRHDFFDDFLNPSLSEDMGLYANAPVMVFSTETL